MKLEDKIGFAGVQVVCFSVVQLNAEGVLSRVLGLFAVIFSCLYLGMLIEQALRLKESKKEKK